MEHDCDMSLGGLETVTAYPDAASPYMQHNHPNWGVQTHVEDESEEEEDDDGKVVMPIGQTTSLKKASLQCENAVVQISRQLTDEEQEALANKLTAALKKGQEERQAKEDAEAAAHAAALQQQPGNTAGTSAEKMEEEDDDTKNK